jgi:hypothetical protein
MSGQQPPPQAAPKQAKGGAEQALDDMQKKVEERLFPKLKEAQAKLDQTNDRVKGFIRKNPGAVLLGAGLLGFALGRWAARR